MHNFRVELHAVQFLVLVHHGSYRAFGGMGDDGKAFRHLFHIVLVAHPADIVLFQSGEQTGFVIQHDGRFPVFAAACVSHYAAQGLGHELMAVADTQNRNPHFEHACINGRGIFGIYTVGAAG